MTAPTPIFEAGANEQRVLNQLLKKTPTTPEKSEQVSTAEARHAEKLAIVATGRTAIRVLFITTDTALLTQATKSLDGYLPLASLFDEVHLLVLRTGVPSPHKVLRIAPNAWMYTATARHEWNLPDAGWQLLQEQFVFAEGFRPDLIVARDPYESALLALWASKAYDRPTQLHLTVGYEKSLRAVKELPRWRRLLAWYTKARFVSVRTETESLAERWRKEYEAVSDVAVLPLYRDYTALLAGERGHALQQKYPQFTFVIVYFGTLSHGSTAWQVLDAVRDSFRNPRLGLVVVGDGPARAEFVKRAELLGITEQVVFERKVDDLMSYLQSADMVVITDVDEHGDEVALYSAATATPVVMTITPTRQDLFTHGQSALLVEAGDQLQLKTAIGRLVSDALLRRSVGEAARAVVASRLHVDPAEYQLAYRDSVEEAIITYSEVHEA